MGFEPIFWWLKVICINRYTKIPSVALPKVRLELTTKAASKLCSTNWASQAMEISGTDPEPTLCKSTILPIKLYPLFINIRERTWTFKALTPTKLKLVVFTNFTTQTRAKVIWTLIFTVMSSMLCQLSYIPMRTKELHPYHSDMSRICLLLH